MARPTRPAPLSIGILFLLSIGGVNSASTPSCTDDCAPFFIPGAVAYWPMTLKTKGSDMSGNENHATFVGLTYSDGPNGERNGAVHFHGNVNSYALINKSPSMEVGKDPGFSFCGFVRFSAVRDQATLIDWRDIGYKSGVRIWALPAQNLWLSLQDVRFPNMKFTSGAWRFFGVSYDKSTGKVTGFMDGIQEQKQIDKNLVAATANKASLGSTQIGAHQDFTLIGDMSCLMLFKVALTADDFERVWRFCRTESTQTTLPNITVSDIAATTATASWTKSPGTFSRYNITIERKQSVLEKEIIGPRSIPSSTLLPKVTLANLIPNATYRIRVWHMQGDINGGALSSAWFNTVLLFPVKPGSIIFSKITATSAEVTWDDEIDNADGYSVEIRPTTGGAKVVPNTVPRGTTTTSLKNLSPGSYYTITIRSKIGSTLSSPSLKSFQTPVATDPPEPKSPIAVIGLILTVICLVVIIALVAVIVILFRRITYPSTGNVRYCSR